ncbi:unnamed protein product, partial [Mesorhabditis belari]|uniref:C-type lectin domain-containing protein n=1 Tax=Mesorhabditis belari TaxID=2138241 RepID=A0AAF3F962_9BILA
MGVMAVGLFITIPLLFHQISSSIQESVQVDPFTSPNDRDEIRDHRTLNSKEDCPDTVCLRSCQPNLNQTQQELVEARGKISGLEREIARGRNETKDKDVEMSRLTAKMAQIEANLMGKVAKTKRKNDDLEAQLRTQNMEARDGKAKIGELEGKINVLQSKNSDLETQINQTMNLLDLYRDGWSYLAKTASWYKVTNQRMAFDEAAAYCASRESHLVSIHSQEEHDFVWELAKTVSWYGWFWIGLKRNPNKGNAFEWTDGSSVDFTNWRVEEPGSNTHAYQEKAGNWGTYTQYFQAVCARKDVTWSADGETLCSYYGFGFECMDRYQLGGS